MSGDYYDLNDAFMAIVANLMGIDGSWRSAPRSSSPALLALAADLGTMENVAGFFSDLNLTPVHAREIALRMPRQAARLYWDARAGAYAEVGALRNLEQPARLNAFHRAIDRLWTMLQEGRYISASNFATDYANYNPHQVPSSAAWWIEDSDGARWLVLAGLYTLGRRLPTVDVPDAGPPSAHWDSNTPEIRSALETRFRDVSFAACYKAADVLAQHGLEGAGADMRARYDDLFRRRWEDYLRVSGLLAPAGWTTSKRNAFVAQLEQDGAAGCIGSFRVREIKRALHLGQPLAAYRALEDHLDHVAELADPVLSVGYQNLCPSEKMLWTYDEWYTIVDHIKNYSETVIDVLRRYGWIK
jgi:hypothetical protein